METKVESENSNEARIDLAPTADASDAVKARLRYSHASLASSKYVSTTLAATSFALAVLTNDRFFTGVGLAFAAIALGFAGVQNGLLKQRRWARRIAIGFSFLQLPSLAFPLALLSLSGLLSREVSALFRSGQVIMHREPLWRAHRLALALGVTVFVTLVTTGLVRRELRVRTISANGSVSSAQRASRAGALGASATTTTAGRAP